MIKLRAFLLASLLPISGVAWAEGNCPDGQYPIGGGDAGWQGCAGDVTQPEEDYSQAPDAPNWQDRYGAIAVGSGGWGSANDMPSESQANKAAVKQCAQSGKNDGSKCKVFSYHNACAVIVWGATGYITQSAKNLTVASSLGMKKCSSQYAECEIYYQGCSHAQRLD